MMRLWLTMTLVLFFALTLFISIAVAIGTVMPQKPVLASFQPCAETFCWLDINVQQTSSTQATAILTDHDYTTQDNSVYFAPPDNAFCDAVFGGSATSLPVGISSIQLLNCPNLQFGDIANVFGEPQFISLECIFDTWIMWYDNNIAVLVNGELTPHSPVFQVIFFNQAAFDRPTAGIQWRGFLTKWRQGQLEGRDC